MPNNFIWIVTDESTPSLPADGTKGSGWQSDNLYGEPGFPASSRTKPVPVQVEKLEQNMSDFLSNMGQVLNRARQSAAAVAGMELDEIELSVEISGEGQVSLLGSGVKASSKGAMTLKFKAK